MNVEISVPEVVEIFKEIQEHWIFHIRYRQQAPGRLLAIQLLPLA